MLILESLSTEDRVNLVEDLILNQFDTNRIPAGDIVTISERNTLEGQGILRAFLGKNAKALKELNLSFYPASFLSPEAYMCFIPAYLLSKNEYSIGFSGLGLGVLAAGLVPDKDREAMRVRMSCLTLAQKLVLRLYVELNLPIISHNLIYEVWDDYWQNKWNE